MTSEQRERYGQELVKVLRHRDPSYQGSSADYDYLRTLLDREIPLAIALLGISQCNGKPGRVTLRYYKPAIEEAIIRWATALPR